MSRLLLLVVLVCAVSAYPQCQTPWKDCGSTDVTIDNVIVPGCCSAPCELVDHKNATVSFTFTPKKTFTDMKEKLCGIIAGVCVPFPIPPREQDVCNLVTCPLEAGKTYNITVTILVDSPILITTTGKWELDSPGPVGCFEMPLKIVKG